MVFVMLGEDAWLKNKLSENKHMFGGLLAASSAASANPVLPASSGKLISNSKAMLGGVSISGSAAVGMGGGDLSDGGSWEHRWDKSASCAWNSLGCKI